MTAASTPERSLRQRLDALGRANEVRVRRAALKRQLKAGHVSVHSLLLDPPKSIETMKIVDLLLATPGRGAVKVHRILTQCRISPSKTLGGLTERQRAEITSLLLGRRVAPRSPPSARAYAPPVARVHWSWHHDPTCGPEAACGAPAASEFAACVDNVTCGRCRLTGAYRTASGSR